MRLLSLVATAIFALAPNVARADSVSDARAYFRAGAAAYAAGDYLAAIQALEAAYRETPLPAIAFSLAQAERRQYFAALEPQHLRRAIELFRDYVEAVRRGGRRADAIEALSQLEPLAVSLGLSMGDAETSSRVPATKTRVMVTSQSPGAEISLDGAAPIAAPLIAEVSAGRHTVKATAPGFFPAERGVVAVQGELVPLEIELKERPAVVLIQVSGEADLYIDGNFAREVESTVRLELPSGEHRFSFAKKGHRLSNLDVKLARGETRNLYAELELSRQRFVAYSLFAASGVSLGAGLVFSALAVDEERDAQRLLTKREQGSLVPSELNDYDDALEGRARYRAVAVGWFALSAASLATGFLLYELDQPDLREVTPRSSPSRPQPAFALQAAFVPSPDGLGVAACGTW